MDIININKDNERLTGEMKKQVDEISSGYGKLIRTKKNRGPQEPFTWIGPPQLIKSIMEALREKQDVIKFMTNIINKSQKDTLENPFWKRLTTYFYMKEDLYDGEVWGIIKDEDPIDDRDNGSEYGRYNDYEVNLTSNCPRGDYNEDEHLCTYFAKKIIIYRSRTSHVQISTSNLIG